MSRPRKPLEGPCKTEGQRLLRGLPGAARTLGASLSPPQSPAAMSYFLLGARTPSPDTRREMERVLGIPAVAWEQHPSDAPPPPAPEQAPAPAPAPRPAPAPKPRPAPPAPPAEPKQDGRKVARSVALPPSDLDEAEGNTDLIGAAERVVRQALNLMQTANLTPTEARAAQERALKGLEALQRLRHQDEVRESTLARHPVFARMLGVILDEIKDLDTLTRLHARLTEWRG